MNLAPFIDGSYGIAVLFLIGIGVLTFTRYRRAVTPAARGRDTLMRARKKRRLYLLLACGLCLCAATGLMLAAFSSTLTYFLSPRAGARQRPGAGHEISASAASSRSAPSPPASPRARTRPPPHSASPTARPRCR